MKPETQRLCDALRRELLVHKLTVSDERILEITKDSFLRARVELGLALKDLRLAILDALPKWFGSQWNINICNIIIILMVIFLILQMIGVI